MLHSRESEPVYRVQPEQRQQQQHEVSNGGTELAGFPYHIQHMRCQQQKTRQWHAVRQHERHGALKYCRQGVKVAGSVRLPQAEVGSCTQVDKA